MKTIFFLRTGAILAFSVLCAFPAYVHAEESLTLTVTPPLFQLTIGPGEFWASSVKVINTNPYDLTVFATAVNFRQQGEDGQGSFLPILDEGSEHTLASWIELSKEGVHIKKGASGEIPFSLRVPTDASPGSHYAAIMVGTRPNEGVGGQSQVRVSSMVSSLLFLRIKGDIREEGYIREFSTDQALYERPGGSFTLRFANTGNVHIRPQGEIRVEDMWGRERAKFFVNKDTEFGNVLPLSVRKFSFLWEDNGTQAALLSAGRYTASATLVFGEDSRQSALASVSFWVLPLRPLAILLLTILLLGLLATWFVRRSVQRSLERVGIRGARSVRAFRMRRAVVVSIIIILVVLILFGNNASETTGRVFDAIGALLQSRTVSVP